MSTQLDLDTSRIHHWQSILSLVVFVLTNLVVLFPFHIPVYVPRKLYNACGAVFRALRVIPPRRVTDVVPATPHNALVRLLFPMDFLTAPIIADLLLLATKSIGRQEVHDGTVGANHIAPIDIMAFFISLAYIAISIDASGLIRWMACKVLQKGARHGHRLFFYLYTFFFAMACFVGNDPIVLSGTAFLAYMTRVASNITNEKAWIYSQFAMANVGSAVLVSSNPTNLVLAGAFHIKFIAYTANVIVPVLATVVILFPFLLYLLFRRDGLVPKTIQMHELPEHLKGRAPVNPNIPTREQAAEEDEDAPLLELLNPHLDKPSAIFGSCVMAATLVTILVLNASSPGGSEHPVFWVTVPAAVLMLSWDLSFGWIHRDDTRRLARGEGKLDETLEKEDSQSPPAELPSEKTIDAIVPDFEKSNHPVESPRSTTKAQTKSVSEVSPNDEDRPSTPHPRASLQSLITDAWSWLRQTFPTTTVVLRLLPLKLVPFALAMFILVQALVTKGWVSVFAHGWDHWVERTGTIGAVGGMAFLSVILCNFAGTNIGTTILLCRVVQAWVAIHDRRGTAITQRTFWATVYSMAIGVNYGAFSTAFSASLAGLLWRDILARKNIHVRSRDFAWVNLPIITLATIVGCAVLIGQVYITRNQEDYKYVP